MFCNFWDTFHIRFIKLFLLHLIVLKIPVGSVQPHRTSTTCYLLALLSVKPQQTNFYPEPWTRTWKLDLSNDLKWLKGLKGNLYEWVKVWEIFLLLLLLLVVVIEDDSTCYRIFPLWQRCWISLLEMVHQCLPVNGAKGTQDFPSWITVQWPSPYGCEQRVTNLIFFVATQRVMCFFLRA